MPRTKNQDEQILNGNDAYQGPSEHDIRKNIANGVHGAINDQLERREHSLKHAVKVQDTAMQWDLIAAADEIAVIKVFELGKEEAEKMRGRSRITFSKQTKRLLRDIADEAEDEYLLTRAKWLAAAAGHHTSMGNKLIAIARYMKSKARDAQRTAEVRLLCHRTAAAYKELAAKLSKRKPDP